MKQERDGGVPKLTIVENPLIPRDVVILSSPDHAVIRHIPTGNMKTFTAEELRKLADEAVKKILNEGK